MRLELRKEIERVRDLGVETFERILSFAPERYRPHFRTLLQTGLRLAEFVRLTPAHLRPARRLVNVPGTKTPFSENYIKVDPDFWPDLLSAVRCPITGNGLYQVWRQACDEAGVVGARSTTSGMRSGSGASMRMCRTMRCSTHCGTPLAT